LTGRHSSNLRCAYLPFERYEESAEPWKSNVLGTVCFSRLPAEYNAAGSTAPIVPVPLQPLAADGTAAPACEIWCADGALTHGQRGALRYCQNDEILFGAVQLAESEFDAGAVHESGKTPLQQASESAYREIFKLADALDFTHILRFWNYIADINGQSHGIERYRQFNMGRQDGFLSAGRDVKGSVPAASAVGFADGPLTIYFLAGRNVTPIAIENPRQVSAYQYPKDYGQRSPTFSRASVVQLGGNDVFFLSGTASIVGHRTLHVGDVVAQTRETLANITAIIAEANRVAPRAGFALGDLCYKVYVRHEQDVNAIHNELRRSLGQSARMMFLKADICRQDLLMEIEASAGHPLEC
jgi:enamine deaminase RidA (YjgF/YER057c/UK114 family)